MDTNEILKKVRKIEIKTKGLSKHIFSGEYHSAFKGKGMSFSEVREYQYGDDVRNIDWNVTARTGDPFVKVFEEERELTLMLLVDISKSTLFGTRTQMKSELITELSAVLAFSATQNNDKVGAILFSSEVEKYIPPKKGKGHILRIIREIIYHEAKHPDTNIKAALEYLNNIQKKKSIAFLLSDFMDTGYEDAVSISARKHDLIGMHITDTAEKELINVGLLKTIDAETGKPVFIDTSSRAFRNKYRKWYDSNFNYFNTHFKKSGADLVSIKTGEDYVKLLLHFFKSRSK